jgi:hypothetical protein
MSLRRLLFSQMSLRRLLVSQMSLRGALLTQDLVCGELGNAAVSCRELVNAAVSCGVQLVTQRPPARIVVDADLSCEAPFYTRGARGSEGAHSYTRGARGSEGAHFYTRGARGSEGAHVLHRGARGSDSRGHGSSQARRQEGHHDTSECEDRSPGFFWTGNSAPFIIFRLRLDQGTSCAVGSENHCLVIGVEDV